MISESANNAVYALFYMQHFYNQRQAETGKKSCES